MLDLSLAIGPESGRSYRTNDRQADSQTDKTTKRRGLDGRGWIRHAHAPGAVSMRPRSSGTLGQNGSLEVKQFYVQ